MYAFLEQDMFGCYLEPKVSANMTLLSLSDVAGSDYTILFRFYLGELVREFAILGRSKALRHCVKFLKAVAVPFMASSHSVNKGFIATYSAFMVLLMGMAGVPVKI